MVQYVITPWRSPSELLHVRQQFYHAKDNEERRYAVAKVSVWMQRGNCPHLVESTAILTSAILNDVPGNSAYCVRAAYSAAFCRFVTGLLDSHQTSHKKLSMYSIAKQLSLPATYVELRHQATHEELPSLSKLRSATQKALRWIWEYYWVNLKGEEMCKDAIRRYLEGGEEDIEEMLIGKWRQEELLKAVLEVQETVEGNAGALKRALKLQRRVLDEPALGISEVKSIEDVRREMAEMETELEGSNQSAENEVAKDLGSKGWAVWEGPWVAKPIGVV